MVGLSISQWLYVHLLSGFFVLGGNLVKSCKKNYDITLFEQLINIARFVEMWMFVRVCASVEVEVALHIYFHSIFHTPVNNSYSIQNRLLCTNSGDEPPLVTKNEKLNI